jgi:hypothetical protein
MHSHPNARLTQRPGSGLSSSIRSKAAALPIWLPRTGSASAAPTAGWSFTDQAVRPLWRSERALDLPHQRLHLRHIARLLRAPFSTVARTLSSLGLGRLRNLEPKPPVHRGTSGSGRLT